MKSEQLGRNTFSVEVTNISPNGIWLLADEEELLLPFKEFPWFVDARLSSILKVERPQPEHLYWPDLDIDLSLESVRHPEQYPLTAKTSGKGSVKGTA